MRNKRGFTFFYAFMVGILFMFLGLALAPALKDVTIEAMGSSQLNCSNTSISYQNKAVCTQLDLFTYLFSALIFGLVGFLLGGLAV